jgi:protein-S-isoprenylcysteine O-methyltransferase Ste14
VKAPAAIGVSAIWFALAPVLIAGVVPWWLTGWEVGSTWPLLQVLGALLVVAGTVILLDAFARFVREGEGTPAPVAPPTRLVVGGFYRFMRNPMYVAVVLVIIGQALILGRLDLWLYAGGTWLVTAAFARWIEEPMLRAQFGGRYETYRRAVPAWVPRRQPKDRGLPR